MHTAHPLATGQQLGNAHSLVFNSLLQMFSINLISNNMNNNVLRNFQVTLFPRDFTYDKFSFSLKPLHGSVLQFNRTYRYTPFDGFFGNDSFSYTLSDDNNNVVTATVFISVICRPPQFISLPQKLHVTEDTIGPQFG